MYTYILHGIRWLHGCPMQSMMTLGEQAHTTKSTQKVKRQRSFHEGQSKGHTGNVAFISTWPLKVYGLRLGADLPKIAFNHRKILLFITGWPMRTEDEAVRLSRTSPWTTFSWANSPEATLIVAFKGPTLVERSRLVKAIIILFTECFYSVYKIIPRYSHFSHTSADPAFPCISWPPDFQGFGGFSA